jgi:hypothetical protein
MVLVPLILLFPIAATTVERHVNNNCFTVRACGW